MQASLEQIEMGSHCAARRGDELRRQAESCRQLAASSLMERHKLVWLRLANEWLELDGDNQLVSRYSQPVPLPASHRG